MVCVTPDDKNDRGGYGGGHLSWLILSLFASVFIHG